MTIVSPSWAAFRVSVEPLQAGNGLSYVVCLDRGDRPLDAEPWASGRITPVNRNDVEEANFAASEWADFLGVTFTPCEPVSDTRATAVNTVPEYGKYPTRDTVAVERGVLTMALNVLRRAGKEEVADALEKSVDQAIPPKKIRSPGTSS